MVLLMIEKDGATANSRQIGLAGKRGRGIANLKANLNAETRGVAAAVILYGSNDRPT